MGGASLMAECTHHSTVGVEAKYAAATRDPDVARSCREQRRLGLGFGEHGRQARDSSLGERAFVVEDLVGVVGVTIGLGNIENIQDVLGFSLELGFA